MEISFGVGSFLLELLLCKVLKSMVCVNMGNTVAWYEREIMYVRDYLTLNFRVDHKIYIHEAAQTLSTTANV